jgi:hypothetical protein
VATQTFDFAHSDNAEVVTRVVLTDISPGVLNYTISLVRTTASVQSFNNFGSSPGGASIDGITIFGQAVSNRTYTFDWWYTTTQTVRRTLNSSTLRNVPNTGLFRVGMTRQIGLGIPTNAAINIVGSTTVGMTVVASSSGTNSVTFSRPQPAASVLIATANINVAPGTTGGIGGVNNARGSVGSATLSGSFTSYIDAPSWITTSPLATGTRDAFYSVGLDASRATSYSIISGSLPSGLSLSGGTISGTPTTVQSRTFTVRASNTGGSVDREFTINIVVPSPAFSTTSPLPIAIRGSVYSTTISASDTPSTGYSLVSGTPPAGLSLGSNGVVSGTPTTLGAVSFTVRATNTTGSVDRSFSLTVNPPAPTFTDQSIIGGAPRNIPYQSEVVATDAGYGITSPTTAYSIFSGSLPPGLTLNTSTGVIGRNTAPTQAPTTVGTYQFVIRATNVTGSTNTGNLIIVVTNNLGQRRSETGFENITSVRRFDGTNWQPTTIAKRFDGTNWVDVTNS